MKSLIGKIFKYMKSDGARVVLNMLIDLYVAKRDNPATSEKAEAAKHLLDLLDD